jgi:DNA gyrase subunit B
MVEFDFKTLEHRLRELAFLNSGVRILLARPSPSRTCRGTELFYEGGLEAFVQLSRQVKGARSSSTPIVIALGKGRHHRRSGAAVERQLPRKRAVLHQQHSRSAMAAPTSPACVRALTRQVTGYADLFGHHQEGKGRRSRVTIPVKGLTCVLSVKVPDPKFSSQTKDKLVSSEVRPVGREHRQREARPVVRGTSQRGADHCRARLWKPPPPARQPARHAN